MDMPVRFLRPTWSSFKPPTNRPRPGRRGSGPPRPNPRTANPRGRQPPVRLLGPLPSPPQPFSRTILQDALHVELIRPDHEVDVHGASIAARSLELLVVHRFASVQRELVCRPERCMACGVLIEQG